MHTARFCCIVFFLGFSDVISVVDYKDWGLPDNETDVNGIPVGKYFTALERLNEIFQLLNGIKTNNSETRRAHSDARRDESIANDRSEVQVPPMFSPYLFQGDILLSEEQLDEITSHAERRLAEKLSPGKKSFNPLLERPRRRWMMPIPYVFYSGDGGLNMARRAMKMWTDATCVRFEYYRYPPQRSAYLKFEASSGCSAAWGLQNIYGPNNINIGQGCGTAAVVAHELGHTLGLYHTQSRADRDNYVFINKNNIKYGYYYNFEYAPEPTVTLGVPYDYGSVMHYEASSFPSYPGLTTIVTSDPRYQTTIGNRQELSFYDIKIINLAYCNDSCSTRLPCQNYGYTDPLNCFTCRCPTGFAGTLCEVVEKTETQCGQHEFDASEEYKSVSFSGTGNCNFLIKGHGRKVELVIESYPSYQIYNQACKYSYLEVKYKQDLGLTGARFCGRNRVQTIPSSQSSDTVMLIYKSNQGYTQFRVKFRSDGPKQATTQKPSTPPTTNTPVTTLETTSTSTLTTTNTTTTFTTTTSPKETWSQWSPCSYYCGGCGTRQRYNPQGNVESEYCNTSPCPGAYCCSPFRLSFIYGKYRCLKPFNSGPPPRDGQTKIESNFVKFINGVDDKVLDEGSGTDLEAEYTLQ